MQPSPLTIESLLEILRRTQRRCPEVAKTSTLFEDVPMVEVEKLINIKHLTLNAHREIWYPGS